MKLIKNILTYLSTWKEEALVTAVALMMFLFFRMAVVIIDPQAALYDLGKFEDLTYGILKFWVIAFTAWIAVRVLLPPAFEYLKNEFYSSFKSLEKCDQRKYSLLAFLACFFALVLLCQ